MTEPTNEELGIQPVRGWRFALVWTVAAVTGLGFWWWLYGVVA